MKKVRGLWALIVLAGMGLLLQAQTRPVVPGRDLSATPTFTPSVALTLTPTATPSFTPNVPLLTPTITGTQSPSLTPTPTLTASLTPTPSPTQTSTLTATSTPGVFQFSVSPQPDAQGLVHFKWGNSFPADEAYLRVFTSGFRLVWEETYNKNEKPEYLVAGDHEVAWNGRNDMGRPMPPGYYICFISMTAGKKNYETSAKTEIP